MIGERRSSLSLSVLATLALPLGALAEDFRQGSEFQVNTYTTGEQYRASVALEADGDFVVVWYSNDQDGSGAGVFASRFSSAGALLASELQVNAFTTGNQRDPTAAASASGNFVVAWTSTGQDGANDGVFARRFSSAGAALASEFQVSSFTAGLQRDSSLAADADGDFVIAWHSIDQDGDSYGIFARRFSSGGTALASEFQVNTYTTGFQRYPSVATDASGDFVVAWTSIGQDGSGNGIFARRFSSAGAPLASELQVNTYTVDSQRYPSVAVDPGGDFVVVWHSNGQDGSGNGIFARGFSSAGTALASEFQINTYTTDVQSTAWVAALAGDFVVAWHSNGQDGSLYGVFGRRISSAGAPLGCEFQVSTYVTGNQFQPAAAANASGDFVVAWQSSGQDGSGQGIFAQRFSQPVILDIDGNGSVTALTDGLLVLRFLFGFTGTTLTTGVVGPGCTRCDSDAIAPYLDTLI